MLSRYIQSLHEHVEQVNKERELAKRQEAGSLQTIQSAGMPLEVQLIQFFRTLSQEQLERPWTMDELVIRLRGRYRDRPHPQQVGTVLRRIGWQQQRNYGHGGGGRRYWVPPAYDPS